MRSLLGVTAFLLIFGVAVVGMSAAALPTLLTAGEFWMPEHTGIFFAGGRLVGIGLLAHPPGVDVMGSTFGLVTGGTAACLMTCNVLWVALGLYGLAQVRRATA